MGKIADKISESTFVPISLVILVISVAYWAGGLDHKVTVAEASVIELTVKHEEAIKELRKINERLSEISGILQRRQR